MREIVRAAVEAVLYFADPRDEKRRAGRPPRVPISEAPPPSNNGRPRGGARHPRSDYWREYARLRYHTDPEWRRRRNEAVMRSRRKKRGAK